MKKEYDFKDGQRGRFYKKGATMQLPNRRGVDVHFKTTRQVVLALHELSATGLFGDGGTVGSVAEELLRWALLQPGVLEHWHPRASRRKR